MKRLILILILSLTIVRIASAQDTPGRTLDILNLRAEPALGNNLITQLPVNTPLTILGRNNIGNWLWVSATGVNGWVASQFVDWDGILLLSIPITNETAPIPATPSTMASESNDIVIGDTMRVTSQTRLNIRSQPNISGMILGALRANQTVTAIGRNLDGTWLAIDNGQIRGWVATAYLSLAGDITNLALVEVLPSASLSVTSEPIAPAQTPVTTSDNFVITGPAVGNSTSYDMEFTLHWNTTANLDLHVMGPDGYTIVPGIAPSPTGGYFQQAIGANEDCNTAEGAALEVITWDKGTAPSGLYQIQAEHVNDCFPEQEEDTLFWVSVKNDGPEVEFWVFFIKPGELFEFEFTRP